MRARTAMQTTRDPVSNATALEEKLIAPQAHLFEDDLLTDSDTAQENS